MKLRPLILGCALASALAGPAAAAGLANPGFETGDLSGWSYTDGLVFVVPEAFDAVGTPPFGEHFTPVEGEWFARLTAGLEPGEHTILSQAFVVPVASRLSGEAAFLAFDSLPYDDDAYVRIYAQSTNEVLFFSNVSAVGDFGHTAWTSFTSGLLLPGQTYVLEAGVRDALDFGFSSELLLDNIALSAAPAPEPASWALMIGGFGLAGAHLRRRRAAGISGAAAGASGRG